MGRTKEQGITYEERIKVKLDGKHVGDIKVLEIPENRHGNEIVVVWYQYFPKGRKEGGERFESLQRCKNSLEAL